MQQGIKQTDGCSPRRVRWRLPSLLVVLTGVSFSNAAVSQDRKTAGLAARSATFFEGCLWWLGGLRAEGGLLRKPPWCPCLCDCERCDECALWVRIAVYKAVERPVHPPLQRAVDVHYRASISISQGQNGHLAVVQILLLRIFPSLHTLMDTCNISTLASWRLAQEKAAARTAQFQSPVPSSLQVRTAVPERLFSRANEHCIQTMRQAGSFQRIWQCCMVVTWWRTVGSHTPCTEARTQPRMPCCRTRTLKALRAVSVTFQHRQPGTAASGASRRRGAAAPQRQWQRRCDQHRPRQRQPGRLMGR